MDQENFEIVNEQIKAFISSYQENPFTVPLKRLSSLHKRLLLTISDLLLHPFVKETADKMTDALDLVFAGDESMLTATDKDSYHTLLWKLHQYLIANHFFKNQE